MNSGEPDTRLSAQLRLSSENHRFFDFRWNFPMGSTKETLSKLCPFDQNFARFHFWKFRRAVLEKQAAKRKSLATFFNSIPGLVPVQI